MVGQMLQTHLSLRLMVVSVWWLSEEVTQVLLLRFSQSQAEAAEGFGPSFGQKLKQLPSPLVRRVFGLQNREQNREAWDILDKRRQSAHNYYSTQKTRLWWCRKGQN